MIILPVFDVFVMVGYQRDDLLKTWNCIQMKNLDTLNSVQAEAPIAQKLSLKHRMNSHKMFTKDEKYLEDLQASVSWTVKHHEDFEKYTLGEMQARMGHEQAPKDYRCGILNLNRPNRETHFKILDF